MSGTITTDAWLAELERVQQKAPAGYLTVSQMSEQTGHGRDWIGHRLTQFRHEGRLATRTVQDTDNANRVCWKTAYRILPKGK